MRTALIAWDYPPSPSGLSTAAREIAESLAEAGTDVTVFALDREGTSRSNGVAIAGCRPAPGSRLARLRARPALGRLAAPLALRRAVLAAHRARPFDVVEATNWYAPGVLLAGRGSFAFVTRNSTPAAFTREGPLPPRDRLDGWFVDRLEARAAARSDGLISNTEAHAAEIFGAYGLRPGDRPQAAVGLSLMPATVARGRRAAYPGDGGPLRLLFIGQPQRRKGFDLVLDAAERLAAGPAPDFELVLVGVAPQDLPDTLSEAARARIQTLGRLTADKVEDEYERAHLVLAPSRYESFGLVYQEALAFGRPLIACSEDASAREFVGKPAAGLLAAPSGAALAEAIGTAMADRLLRLGLREKALAAAGRFDRASLARGTLALYAEAVLRRRAR